MAIWMKKDSSFLFIYKKNYLFSCLNHILEKRIYVVDPNNMDKALTMMMIESGSFGYEENDT